MEFDTEYRRKLKTAGEAVKVVQSGDWVDYGWCTTLARALDKALAGRYRELYDVKLRGAVAMWVPEVFKVPEAERHFIWNSWHMSGIERRLMEQGLAYYIPLRYSELPRYYRERLTVDVAMFQVAPMDKHGYFNFGPSASHMAAVCERAKTVIVEVNQNIPICLGGTENGIHLSRVDAIVEGEHPPMAQLPSAVPTEIDRAVAELVVEEIPDGACLQLGIGGMPNAVGALIAQSGLRDLGVHTEMYVDSFVDMAEAGQLSGLKKKLNRARQVYAFAAGSQRLYDYLNCNPACMTAAVDYTNDIRVISQLDNFISVNNAVEVDLFGQVNAETVGTRQVSGAGGQLDFVLGAYLSQGGKSFVCCSASITGADGALKSRVVPTLPRGSIVTDTRTNLHFLVTEYGKVNLKGLATWQRAEAIISVAHPDVQDSLVRQAETLHIWRPSNKR